MRSRTVAPSPSPSPALDDVGSGDYEGWATDDLETSEEEATSSEADDSVVTHTREKCEYAGRESSVEDDQYET